MWKFLISIFLISIVSAVFFSTVIIFLAKERSSYSDQVGKSIVVNKDTLIIVDYNTILKTFTLNNGVVVDKRFVVKDSIN